MKTRKNAVRATKAFSLIRANRLGRRNTGAKAAAIEREAKPVVVAPAVAPAVAQPAPVVEAEPPRGSEPQERSSFQLYLGEIGQFKLLTPKQEVSLAKRIRRGDRQARTDMINANLRLVVKIARDYEGYGVPLLDLIGEGNIGLIKSVERFDPRKGAKFSTYASWWIKQAIRRALSNQSKTIRLPVHVVDKLYHIRRAEAKLHDLFGRDPTDEEIAQQVGLPMARVTQYRRASLAPSSLDAPVGDDSQNHLADAVADPNALTPSDQLREQADSALVREVVASLDPREQSVLMQRFGLADADEKTLEEIGAQFGVTRERIRQIEYQALKKLRKRIEKLEAPRQVAWN